MTAQETVYANTDFVLWSSTALDSLVAELRCSCHVPYYTKEDDGRCSVTVNAEHGRPTAERDAAMDIESMLAALEQLTDEAKVEFTNCERREFNIGFECWDSWGYNHTLPNEILQALAKAGCSLSVTLYPMRNPNGTPKV